MKHFWSITVKQHWCNLLNNWSTWRVVLKPKRKNTENGCIQVQRKPRHLHLLWCTFELLHPLQVGCVLMLLLCSYSKVCILRKGVNNIYSELFFLTFYSKSPATSVVRENTAMFDFHFWVNCSKVLAVPSWEKLPFLINLLWHLDRALDWFLQLGVYFW